MKIETVKNKSVMERTAQTAPHPSQVDIPFTAAQDAAQMECNSAEGGLGQP